MRLELDYNQIASLPAGLFDQLVELKQLYLQGNRLKSLPGTHGLTINIVLNYAHLCVPIWLWITISCRVFPTEPLTASPTCRRCSSTPATVTAWDCPKSLHVEGFMNRLCSKRGGNKAMSLIGRQVLQSVPNGAFNALTKLETITLNVNTWDCSSCYILCLSELSPVLDHPTLGSLRAFSQDTLSADFAAAAGRWQQEGGDGHAMNTACALEHNTEIPCTDVITTINIIAFAFTTCIVQPVASNTNGQKPISSAPSMVDIQLVSDFSAACAAGINIIAFAFTTSIVQPVTCNTNGQKPISSAPSMVDINSTPTSQPRAPRDRWRRSACRCEGSSSSRASCSVPLQAAGSGHGTRLEGSRVKLLYVKSSFVVSVGIPGRHEWRCPGVEAMRGSSAWLGDCGQSGRETALEGSWTRLLYCKLRFVVSAGIPDVEATGSSRSVPLQTAGSGHGTRLEGSRVKLLYLKSSLSVSVGIRAARAMVIGERRAKEPGAAQLHAPSRDS
ncbi:unnamed protein product [Lampetra planeri]